MTAHSPDSETTRQDDSHLQRLRYAEKKLHEQELAKANPGFFEQTTVPILGEADILENTTVQEEGKTPLLRPSRTLVSETAEAQAGEAVAEGAADAEDITFLHPRDVFSWPAAVRLPSGQAAVTGGETAGPEKIFTDIESKVTKTVAAESPVIEEGLPAGVTLPAINAIPQTGASLEEISRALAQSLEEICQKDSLEGADAYRLYELIQLDPEDPALRALIKKIAPSRLDHDVFWSNRDLLSPQFIQSVLAIGGHQEINLDAETGRQKVIMIYSGPTLQKSLGHVFHAWWADSNNLKLRQVLIKIPVEQQLEMASLQSRLAFEDEMEVARRFGQISRTRAGDHRLRHLLMPQYRGIGFLTLPVVKNPKGKSRDLNKMLHDESVSTQQWAKCLAGGVRGVSLAAEEGFINTDFKPFNIIEGTDGGVVIDLGGFLDTGAYGRGEIEVRTNPLSGNLYPLINNGLRAHQSNDYWDINNGNVQRTPAYVSMHLLAQELNGQMPMNTVHKFSVYRIIESYFILRGHASREINDFIFSSELEKLNFPPLEVHPAELTPAEQLLFDLYLKLHQAHRHPWRFRDNNPAHGIDPDYISIGEVIARLDEIVAYPE